MPGWQPFRLLGLLQPDPQQFPPLSQRCHQPDRMVREISNCAATNWRRPRRVTSSVPLALNTFLPPTNAQLHTPPAYHFSKRTSVQLSRLIWRARTGE